MAQRYTDYIDISGTFAEVVDFAQTLIGPLAQEKNTLAVKGIVGAGYFIREDAFQQDGVELHRIYLALD